MSAIAEIRRFDTITKLNPAAQDCVAVTGSHGALYPGHLALRGRVRAVISNDGGVGKDQAGIAGLRFLEKYGMAAAAVSHLSCRIGDTADMMARGRISFANAIAHKTGVKEGMACAEAAELLRQAPSPALTEIPEPCEQAIDLDVGGRRIIRLLDSASQIRPSDEGKIIVTGSHGGLPGGDPMMALRGVKGFAGVFNDAGIGIDNAGTTRLPALENWNIAAFTVSVDSARIGEGQSTFQDGMISTVNSAAEKLGARVGQRAHDVLAGWAKLP